MPTRPIVYGALAKGQFSEDPGFYKPQRDPTPTTFGEAMGAAGILHSDLYNLKQMYDIHMGTAVDPDWDMAEVKNSPYFVGNEAAYLSLGSREQMLKLDQMMAVREKARYAMEATGGLIGTMAEVSAGIASPISLIPYLGQVRTLRDVGHLAAFGAGQVAASEMLLHANQPERSFGESATAVLSGAAFASVLGGMFKFMAPAERDAVAAAIDEGIAKTSRRPQAEGGGSFGGGTLSAARTDDTTSILLRTNPETGALETQRLQAPVTGSQRVDETVSSWNPVSRQVNNTALAPAQHAMVNLADDATENVVAREGVAPALGGSVEHRTRTWDALKGRAIEILDEGFKSVVLGPDARGPFQKLRASLLGRRSDFMVEVTRALFNKDKVVNPRSGFEAQNAIVEEVARKLRKEVLDPLYERAIEVGYLTREQAAHIGDPSYLSRLWDSWKIASNPVEFRRRLAGHFKGKLETQFNEALLRLQEMNASRAQEISDINLTGAEAAKRMQQIRDDFAMFFDANRHYFERDEEIKYLRRIVKEFSPDPEAVAAHGGDAAKASHNALFSPEELKAISDEADRLEKEGLEGLQEFRKVRNTVRRRLANLARTADARTAKQNRLNQQIDGLIDRNIRALVRLESRIQALRREASRYSDEVFAQKSAQLEKMIEATNQQITKNEARIEKINKQLDEFENVGLEEPEAATVGYVGQDGQSYKHGKNSGTMFVNPEDLPKLQPPQSGAEYKYTVTDKGTVFVAIKNKKGEWRMSPRSKNISFSREPEVGKVPLEPGPAHDVGGYTNLEVRSPITEVRKGLTLSEKKASQEAMLAKKEELLAKRKERLDALNSIDRADKLEALNDIADDFSLEIDRLNRSRAEKIAKVQAKIQQQGIPVEEVAKRTKQLEDLMKRSTRDLMERFNSQAQAGDVAPSRLPVMPGEGGALTHDFQPLADRMAEDFYNTIMKNPVQTPGIRMLRERGSALARMLDVKSLDFEDFIETDPEKILSSYIRTLAPDVELFQRFGEPGVQKYVAENGLIDQARKRRQEEIAAMDISPEEKRAMQQALDKATFQAKEDLGVVVARIRHERGIPENPNSIPYRMGRAALEAQVPLKMGKVVINSVQDIMRPIMKYGLVNTMRHGFVPLIQGLKGAKINRRSIQYMGTALDVILHTRANMMFDLTEDIGRRNMFERGIKFLSDKTGVVAGFNYWNTMVKQFSGTVFIGKMLENIDAAAAGRATPDQLSFLAHYGIDSRNLQDIVENLDKHSTVIDGVKVPNTEDWSTEARITFHQAVVKGVDDTIITPGAARPNIVDTNLLAKLVFQFKSFTLVSTNATLVAGLQQRDMGVFVGMMGSLALGAMSYYLWATSMGGRPESEMLNAPIGRWAEEAIDRSGLLGVFGEVRRVADTIPFVPTVFDDSRLTRQSGGFLRQVAGPTGSWITELEGVLKAIDEPTRGTLDNINDLLLPYNNVFYVERVAAAVNDALASTFGIPETRK